MRPSVSRATSSANWSAALLMECSGLKRWANLIVRSAAWLVAMLAARSMHEPAATHEPNVRALRVEVVNIPNPPRNLVCLPKREQPSRRTGRRTRFCYGPMLTLSRPINTLAPARTGEYGSSLSVASRRTTPRANRPCARRVQAFSDPGRAPAIGTRTRCCSAGGPARSRFLPPRVPVKPRKKGPARGPAGQDRVSPRPLGRARRARREEPTSALRTPSDPRSRRTRRPGSW